MINTNSVIKKVRRQLGIGSDNERAFSGKDIIDSANDNIQNAVAIIVNCSGEWEFNGEWSEADLTMGQKEYPLTTDIPVLNLERIEVNFTPEKDNSWQVCKITDLRTNPRPFANEIEGNVPVVDLFDNSIVFRWTPTTNGKIRIYYLQAADVLKNGTVYGVSVNTAGTGYNIGDTLTLLGGGNNCVVKVNSVGGSGEILGAQVDPDLRGEDYVAGTTYSVTGGTGSGAKITVISTGLDTINLLPAVVNYIVDCVCLEYAMAFDLTTKINTFKQKAMEDESKIKEYYSNRLTAIKTGIRPVYINMD